MASPGAGRGLGVTSRGTARFLIVAAATFGAMLALQEVAAGPWAGFYRALAGATLGRLGSTHVRFVPLEPRTRWQDTRILITSTRSPLEAETRCGSRLDTYLPAALLLSLVVAGPGTVRGKLRGAAIGLALIHAAAMALIGLALIDQLTDHPELRPFAVPAAFRGPLRSLVVAVRGHLQPMLLFTVLVWLLVTFPWAAVRDGSPTPSNRSKGRRPRG